MFFKSSTKAGAQSLSNMDINLMIPSVINHSHSHKIGSLVLFDGIQETLEVPIGKDLFSSVPSVAIRISFWDVVSTVAIMDIGGVIAQI